ncbi:MAG: IucA/IucC family C-terminal-domain containing protein [Marinobacter sp.]|uniref:IucA/IucC family C-terminal-domain containing protein n=1 Tax=Marinobacter sp. TaxID=50741 RepID=UPI00349FD3B4
MRLMLDPGQKEELASQCRLIMAEQQDRDFALPAARLLEPETCRDLLDRLAPVIGSPNRYVTASLLAKRIAFLTTGSALYAMSALDRGLDLSIDNSILEYRHQDGLWQSRLPLEDLTVTAPSAGARNDWRATVVHRLFAGHLAPLWRSFRAVARVPLPVLWENTAVRVYSLYERRLAAQSCPHRQQRITDDFHFLIHQAPADLFGTDHNPLHRYFQPRQCGEDPNIRIRKTCCYYFRAAQPAKYCSTCPLPLIKAEPRVIIKN